MRSLSIKRLHYPPLHWLAAILLLVALGLYGHVGYLYAKAGLAQWLIADAWQLSLTQQQPVRPWAWADTWPVARLQYHNEDLYVLAGATGNSLAFGPGHMAGTPLPGFDGNSIVGGHRDTHFAFLQQLQHGDQLRVQNTNGEWRTFRVDKAQVRNIQDGPLLLDPDRNELQLITCYPFDAINAGGPLRYQVSLSPVITATAANHDQDKTFFLNSLGASPKRSLKNRVNALSSE